MCSSPVPCHLSPTAGQVNGPDRPLLAEGAESEESSGEADGEAEAWGLADVRELHPGLLAHRAARTRDLPALAAALAQGAEVNWADAEDEGKTPLVQAVLGVSGRGFAPFHGAHAGPLPSAEDRAWSCWGAQGGVVGGLGGRGWGDRGPARDHFCCSAWFDPTPHPPPRVP